MLGNNAFRTLTGAGGDNTAIGSEVMLFGWKGNGNTAVGSNAMFGLGTGLNTGNNNTALGGFTLQPLNPFAGGHDSIGGSRNWSGRPGRPARGEVGSISGVRPPHAADSCAPEW